MLTDTASIILLAIQGAIRLGQQGRQAYIDSTRNRALVLPLPGFDPEPNAGAALRHFRAQPEEEVPFPIREAVRKSRVHPENPGITPEEARMALDYYNEHRLLLAETWASIQPSPEGGFITRDAVSAAVKIRRWDREAAAWEKTGQWGSGDAKGPSPLQRMAGTLVEIGIDYFAHIPGALNESSRQGRVVRALFQSLDKVEFADKSLGDLPTRLFIATIEGVSEHSDLLTSDEETQRLVSVTSAALARDVAARIEAISASGGKTDADREDGIVAWAELVFRSVLSSGGRLVASDPQTFLGIDDQGDSALVKEVGGSVLDFVLQLPGGELQRAFGLEGVNVVMTAALRAVGEHPELLIRREGDGEIAGVSAEGLRRLLAGIASELGAVPRLLFRPALVPDITRIILDKTGENLPVLWPRAADDPRRNLLVVAAAKTLKILSAEPPEGAAWTPRFSDRDLMTVTETVLDAFVESPGWLLDRAGRAREDYRVALEAAVTVLRRRGDARLSAGTGAEILCAVLRAVALRQEFVEEVPGGRPLVEAALDVVLSALFPEGAGIDSKAAAVLLRKEIVTALVTEAFQALARTGLADAAGRQAHVDALSGLLSRHIEQIIAGKAWSLEVFLEGLETALPPVPVSNA